MAKLICKKCGYKFESRFGYKPKKCPYCNKEGLEEEQDAQKIIDDVKELLE